MQVWLHFSEHFETCGWKMGHTTHSTTQENTIFMQVPIVQSHSLILAPPFFSSTFLFILFRMGKLEFRRYAIYNYRRQRMCRIIDICCFASPHLFFLLAKSILCYLVRGAALVWHYVTWKVINHSIQYLWLQKFFQ